MLDRLWHLPIGLPLPTQQLAHKRLNKVRALVAFSSAEIPTPWSLANPRKKSGV